ncbi:MAG: ribbon-helix-helix protein, CopG family [Desulfurococcales archaeon]|jgi:metal-responsive CopG/Arc/MetJ family transcriptional regulator|nr:ribbon-helix-helix protein, CopG family [Desulfurococcales archaeon]
MNSKKVKIVSFKLTEEELKRLDSYAQSRGLNRSEIIREALNKIINDEDIYRDLEEKVSDKHMIFVENDPKPGGVARKNKIEIIL